MDIKKFNEMRHEILSDVEKEFAQDLIPARLTEENDIPVLNVLMTGYEEELEETTGEFFFMPSSPDDEIQYFVNFITIFDSVPQENIDELCVAVAMINTYVPVGAFAIDFGAGSLVYKLSYPMPVDIPAETVKENVDITMECTFMAVSDMGYLLTEVAEGVRSAANVLEMIAGDNANI